MQISSCSKVNGMSLNIGIIDEYFINQYRLNAIVVRVKCSSARLFSSLKPNLTIVIGFSRKQLMKLNFMCSVFVD